MFFENTVSYIISGPCIKCC